MGMKKKTPKLHFEHVPLKHVKNLLQKAKEDRAEDAEMSVERPTLKTEPYSIALAVNSKKSR